MRRSPHPRLARALTCTVVGLAMIALIATVSATAAAATTTAHLSAPAAAVTPTKSQAGATRSPAAVSDGSARQLRGVTIGAVGESAAQVAGEVVAARALHASVVRFEVPWSALEPAAAGSIDPNVLAAVDRAVDDATAAGMRVIMLLQSTPCWASSAPASVLAGCVPGQTASANDWPPVQPAAFAAFAAFLAGRYTTRLAAIEIWNEPDQANELYFAGPEKAVRYAAILRAAYPAIKAAAPSVAVLAGSIVSTNGGFLRELYAAGIKGYYDGLAVHFYTLTLAALRKTHEVQLENGDAKPLWLTEFGWSSCYPSRKIEQDQACVTPAVQARNLESLVRSLSRVKYIAGEVIYSLQSSSSEQFGLLGPSGVRKPSFAAVADAFASPFAAPPRVTVKLVRSSGRIVASGSGPVGDYLELEAFKGDVIRYRALFTLNRFNRYSLKLPAVLGSRGLRVRVFQYWQGSAAGAIARI